MTREAGCMGSGINTIARDRRGTGALLNSVSRTALAALSVGLSLGVALPSEARAGAGTVNPVQTSTYILGKYNPTTFGVGTSINAPSPWPAGLYGGSKGSWNIVNYGAIQGSSVGIDLYTSGSTVTNWGTIGGNAGVRVLLPNGGAVTNQSGGSISGYAAVDVTGGVGTVTNAGSITGRVSVASGSINNETGGILTTSGKDALAAFAGNGGSVTNAGTITNSGYAGAAVAIAGGGTVTNSGKISATGTLGIGVYTGHRANERFWRERHLSLGYQAKLLQLSQTSRPLIEVQLARRRQRQPDW
jgi:fibronectin-binding autotransporter adhesin